MDSTVSIKIIASDGSSAVFQKIGGSAKQAASDIEEIGARGTKSLSQLASELSTVGGALTSIGAGMTAAVAVPIAAGTKAAWDQVRAVQQATVALGAYEKDASAVEQVLAQLVAYARSDMGVLFQRQDLFAAAQGLRVMGAETENLVEYVEIMSRAVGLGTVSWDELGRIIGRVGSTGRLAGNEFDELTKAGFQLDSQLRNTNITWDELFDALNQGIPADAMAGQIDTIDAGVIRFQSSIRELGLAFLQVDGDTSEFIEGGLGDRLVDGLDTAREIMLAMSPAAAAFGEAATVAATGAGALADAFLLLPEGVQTTAFMLTGAGGAASLAAGSFLLLLPRIMDTIAAFRALRAAVSVGAIASLGAYGAAAIAAGGAGLILGGSVAGVIDAFRDGESASDRLSTAFQSLASGDVIGFFQALRGEAQGVVSDFADVSQTLMSILDESTLLRASGDEESARFLSRIGLINQEMLQLEAQIAQSEDLRRRAFDATIDQGGVGFEEELQRLRSQYSMTAEETQLYIETLDALSQAYTDPTINIGELQARQEDLAFAFREGMLTGDEYRTKLRDLAVEYGLVGEGADAARDKVQELNATVSDGALGLATLFGYDPPDDTAAAIDEIIGKNEEAGKVAEETAKKFADATSTYHQSVMDWLADGDNILGFLDDFSVKVREGTEWFEQFAEREWAVTIDISQANAAFDQVLRIFDQIDALGSRPSRAQSIAESLVGAPGEWAAIDDLLESGRIKLEQYHATVESGYAIMDSSARQQLILNEIRADQLPLLEAQTLAYEANLERLAALEPAEQRRALLLQDTAVQTQIADLYSQAYAASVGEVPEEVATAVILEAAQADAGLKDLLLQFGLIEEMPDGELRVNFPDADATINAIDRMTMAFLHLAAAEQEIGAFDLAVSIYGREEAEELFGLVERADGTEAAMSVAVSTPGIETVLDDVELVYDRVQNLDGTESYFVLRADVDTGELEDFGRIIDSYASPEDPNIAYILVEADTGNFVTTIENDTGDIGDVRIPVAPSMTDDWQTLADDAFDGGEVVIPVRPEVQAGGIGVGDGTAGAQNWRALLDVPDEVTTSITASVTGGDEVATVTTAIEELPDAKSAAVSIAVTGLDDVEAAADAIEALVDTSVTVSIIGDDSDAQSVAAYWAGYNGITFATATVAIVADESDLTTAIAHWSGAAGGGGEAGGGTSHIGTRSVAIVADTTDIDNALLTYGIGGGDGSGGMAGFDVPTVYVDVAVGSNALDDVLGDETVRTITVDVEANMTSLAASLASLGAANAALPAITVPVKADLGGPDGLLAQIDNIVPPAGGEFQRSITVPVTANTEGVAEALSAITTAADAVPPSVSITAVALTEGAVFALDNVTAAANAIPESESVTVVALAEGATAALQGVTAAANAIPEAESVTVNVYGAASAVSALNSVASAANNIPGSVSTTITTNRVTAYSTIGPRPLALGGTVWADDPLRAANGRSVWVGEYGPELVSLPPGAQVTPHVASLSQAGGGPGASGNRETHLHFHNSTFFGMDDFTEQVMRRMGPALEQADREYHRAMGGV